MRRDAEEFRQTAEALRRVHENAWQAAEEIRQVAEGLRHSTEQTAEIFRQANQEQARILAEMQQTIQKAHELESRHDAPASEE